MNESNIKEAVLSLSSKNSDPEFDGASRPNYQFIGNTEDKRIECFQQNPRL